MTCNSAWLHEIMLLHIIYRVGLVSRLSRSLYEQQSYTRCRYIGIQSDNCSKRPVNGHDRSGVCGYNNNIS